MKTNHEIHENIFLCEICSDEICSFVEKVTTGIHIQEHKKHNHPCIQDQTRLLRWLVQGI